MRDFVLDVPYHDRHLARQLGAAWDVALRRWYVPAGRDPAPLLGWAAASELINVRAHRYYLLRTRQPCEQCRRECWVHAIVLPSGHEVRLQGEDGSEEDWERSDEPTLLAFVTQLEPSIVKRIRAESICYQLRRRPPSSLPYYTNHCEKCRAPFDDYRLYATAGQGFDVLSEWEAVRIEVSAVHSGFAGAAEHFSYGVPFFDAMTRR